MSAEWHVAVPRIPQGILCGTDSAQEWLLPWWWSRYSEHNPFPVTFCDFGMSPKARVWCAERGEVIPIQRTLVKTCEEIDPLFIKEWDVHPNDLAWQLRSVWFSKPAALLRSPYQRAIWIDLDCEILKPIAPVFEQCTSEAEIGILREFDTSHFPRFHPSARYNSGVIVFDHGAPLIQAWADAALHLNHRFLSDDNLLSYLINERRVEVIELPLIYNWKLAQGLHLGAVIVHCIGKAGKEFIQHHGGMKPYLDQLEQLLGRLPGGDLEKLLGDFE